MQAEIQLISPSVPARVMKFFRFSRQQAEGVWAVVDLSFDVDDNGGMCRRLPSGCILYQLFFIAFQVFDKMPMRTMIKCVFAETCERVMLPRVIF